MGPGGTNPVRIDSQGREIADDVPEVQPQPFDEDDAVVVGVESNQETQK